MKNEFQIDHKIYQFQPLDAFTALEMYELVSEQMSVAAFAMAEAGRKLEHDFCFGIVLHSLKANDKKRIFEMAVNAGGYVIDTTKAKESVKLEISLFDGDIMGLQKMIAEYIRMNLADFFIWLDSEMEKTRLKAIKDKQANRAKQP